MDEVKYRDSEEFLEQFFSEPEEVIRSVIRSELRNIVVPERKKGRYTVIRRFILVSAAVIVIVLSVFLLPQNITVTTFSSQNIPHTAIVKSTYEPIWYEYREVSDNGTALFKNQVDTKRLFIEFLALGTVTGLLYFTFRE